MLWNRFLKRRAHQTAALETTDMVSGRNMHVSEDNRPGSLSLSAWREIAVLPDPGSFREQLVREGLRQGSSSNPELAADVENRSNSKRLALRATRVEVPGLPGESRFLHAFLPDALQEKICGWLPVWLPG